MQMPRRANAEGFLRNIQSLMGRLHGIYNSIFVQRVNPFYGQPIKVL